MLDRDAGRQALQPRVVRVAQQDHVVAAALVHETVGDQPGDDVRGRRQTWYRPDVGPPLERLEERLSLGKPDVEGVRFFGPADGRKPLKNGSRSDPGEQHHRVAEVAPAAPGDRDRPSLVDLQEAQRLFTQPKPGAGTTGQRHSLHHRSFRRDLHTIGGGRRGRAALA